METSTLLDCGHHPTPNGMATGVAYSGASGVARTSCYPCADTMERARVADSSPGDGFVAYVNTAGTAVITWSGGELMRRVRWGSRHHFSRERRYLTAVDPAGRVWSGVGAEGMYCKLRLTKNTIR